MPKQKRKYMKISSLLIMALLLVSCLKNNNSGSSTTTSENGGGSTTAAPSTNNGSITPTPNRNPEIDPKELPIKVSDSTALTCDQVEPMDANGPDKKYDLAGIYCQRIDESGNVLTQDFVATSQFDVVWFKIESMRKNNYELSFSTLFKTIGNGVNTCDLKQDIIVNLNNYSSMSKDVKTQMGEDLFKAKSVIYKTPAHADASDLEVCQNYIAAQNRIIAASDELGAKIREQDRVTDNLKVEIAEKEQLLALSQSGSFPLMPEIIDAIVAGGGSCSGLSTDTEIFQCDMNETIKKLKNKLAQALANTGWKIASMMDLNKSGSCQLSATKNIIQLTVKDSDICEAYFENNFSDSKLAPHKDVNAVYAFVLKSKKY